MKRDDLIGRVLVALPGASEQVGPLNAEELCEEAGEVGGQLYVRLRGRETLFPADMFRVKAVPMEKAIDAMVDDFFSKEHAADSRRALLSRLVVELLDTYAAGLRTGDYCLPIQWQSVSPLPTKP